MSYTRRSIIRNAALLSAATAISAPAALLSGCKKEEGDQPHAPKAPVPQQNWIRVFFAGSWLFCADPDPKRAGYMRAVTKQYGPVKHLYPYGNYTQTVAQGFKFDSICTQLQTSNTVNDLTLSGFSVLSNTNVDALFGAISPASPFLYLKNPNKTYQFDFTPNDLCIIRLPIPTRLVPVAYPHGASVDDSRGHILASMAKQGVPSAYIFEYYGATALSFMGAAANSNEDFHFHTVPAPTMTPPPDHAADMFSKLLLGILTLPLGQQPVLNGVDNVPHQSFDPGPDAPVGITDVELETVEDSTGKEMLCGKRSGTLASCAGGGLGLGCGC